MNTYYKIGILVAAVVIIGGLLWFAFLQPDTAPSQPTGAKDVNQILTELTGKSSSQFISNRAAGPGPPIPITPTGVNLAPLTPEELAQSEIKEAASRFVERWGTYSNETDLSSLRALESSMTSQMQSFTDAYINDIRTQYPYQDGYYGITTKAAGVAINNFDINAVRVDVSVAARREETMQNGDVNAYNQNVEVELQKSGETWLVNSVFWLAE